MAAVLMTPSLGLGGAVEDVITHLPLCFNSIFLAVGSEVEIRNVVGDFFCLCAFSNQTCAT